MTPYLWRSSASPQLSDAALRHTTFWFLRSFSRTLAVRLDLGLDDMFVPQVYGTWWCGRRPFKYSMRAALLSTLESRYFVVRRQRRCRLRLIPLGERGKRNRLPIQRRARRMPLLATALYHYGAFSPYQSNSLSQNTKNKSEGS